MSEDNTHRERSDSMLQEDEDRITSYFPGPSTDSPQSVRQYSEHGNNGNNNSHTPSTGSSNPASLKSYDSMAHLSPMHHIEELASVEYDKLPRRNSYSEDHNGRIEEQGWQPGKYSGVATPVADMDRQLRRKLLDRSESEHGHHSMSMTQSIPPLPHSISNSSSIIQSFVIISKLNEFHCGGGSTTGTDIGHGRRILSARPAFKSRRHPAEEGQQELLWTQTTMGKKVYRKAYILFLVGISLGVLGAAALVVTGYMSISTKHKYCIVLEDNFDGPLDTSVWKYEQQTGGFGNNEFEWTTDSSNNSYTANGMLHLVPTLTSDALGDDAILNGYTLNLTNAGTCTSTDYMQCGVASNASTGVVLPPIQSARLTTKGTKSIKFGRVEVRARMPTGDWIWPAIWMMPRDSVYGEWPNSGEIDIVESKGNSPKERSNQLSNVVRSTLHWGPSTDQDSWWRTTGIAKAWRNFFNQDFYTFGLEWDEAGIYTWQGSRVRRFMAVDFNEPFYTRGSFPAYSNNGTQITNPWAESKTPNAAPFDQDFYLIMNVAVGGTNGYFSDTDAGSNGSQKPWSNSGKHAARDFWMAKDKWLPTWPSDPAQRGMVVDYVKMYQQC